LRNKLWRNLFITLLGINILIIIGLWVMTGLPVEEESYSAPQADLDSYVPFKIQTNKQDLNQVINHYLDKEGLTGPVDYRVVLGEEVELYGTVSVFSNEIQMKLTFEPIPLDNGDIVLQQKSIYVGKLQLPVSYVLNFIKDRYQMPEWVYIQPKEEKIYVSLQKMKLKSDIRVKVDEFDLANNQILVTLMVPVK
jgi:uncharacterized protein YpmS